MPPASRSCKLRDPSLELDLKRVHGEMETVRRQLEAARATKTNRDVRDENPVELYRLSASEREYRTAARQSRPTN